MPSPATPAQADPPNPPLGLRLSSLALGLGRVPALQSRAGVLGLAFALVLAVAATSDIYYGLGYPIVVAVMTLVIGRLTSAYSPALAGRTRVQPTTTSLI